MLGLCTNTSTSTSEPLAFLNHFRRWCFTSPDEIKGAADWPTIKFGWVIDDVKMQDLRKGVLTGGVTFRSGFEMPAPLLILAADAKLTPLKKSDGAEKRASRGTFVRGPDNHYYICVSVLTVRRPTCVLV